MRRCGATTAGCRRRSPRSSTCAPRPPAWRPRGTGRARLVHRHALGRQLVPAEQSVHQLAGIAVLLEARSHRSATGGPAGSSRRARRSPSSAERLRLAGDGAAVHADPETVLARRRPWWRDCSGPRSPGAAHSSTRSTGGRPGRSNSWCVGISWPVFSRNFRSQFSQKQVLSRDRPPQLLSVEAFRVGTFDDLGQDAGQIFVVIRAVDAGDELVRGADDLA